MKTDHPFYAGIHSPKELRRDLLMCQKDVLDCMKRHEHVKNIRAEKEMRLMELKKRLLAIKMIMNKVKSLMPAHAIKARVERPEHSDQPVSKPMKKEAQQRKTKIQVLEDELAKIEGKLTSLE
ncbi:MAG: hypothetical protein AABY01_01330 [Nanoarchaeota archaeon]